MSRHLLRTAMALGIAALAFSFTAPVRAEDAATTAPVKPKRHQFTGVIESVDAKAGTLIAKKDTDSKTFKISDKTKYATVDKKDAAVTDIKVGDKVTVSYTEENGANIAHRVGVPAATAKKEKADKPE